MQNNPIVSTLIRQKINQIINSNPDAKMFYENFKGKSEQELKEYAQNVANGRGIDLKEFLSNQGIRIQLREVRS